MSELRILRARQAAADGRLDVEDGRDARDAGAPAFLGKVYDGGALPSGANKVYLVRPVTLDGDEAEGEDATPIVDEERSIPVVFLSPPMAGQTYSAVSIGGRWVSGGGGGRKAARATTDIAACVGTAVGTGTVQPVKNVSGTLTDDGDEVDVGNLGAKISSGKRCMFWTDDYGSVWVEPEECE